MLTRTIFRAIDIIFDKSQNSYQNSSVSKIAQDIVYSDSNACKLDIYSACENIDKDAPIYLYLHGGGFVAGDKKYRRGFCQYIARLGYKVVNINYGLCPEHPYPDFIEHAAQALKWCEEHSEEYKLDIARTVVAGDSAGGYIAQCLTIANTCLEYRDKLHITPYRGRIIATTLFSAPHKPTVAFCKPLPLHMNARLWAEITGNKYAKSFDMTAYKYYDLIDSAVYIDSSFPPTFITHSDKDEFCAGHGAMLAELLKECDISVVDIHSLDDMHDWIMQTNKASAQLSLDELSTFLLAIINDEHITSKTVTIKNGKLL